MVDTNNYIGFGGHQKKLLIMYTIRITHYAILVHKNKPKLNTSERSTPVYLFN